MFSFHAVLLELDDEDFEDEDSDRLLDEEKDFELEDEDSERLLDEELEDEDSEDEEELDFEDDEDSDSEDDLLELLLLRLDDELLLLEGSIFLIVISKSSIHRAFPNPRSSAAVFMASSSFDSNSAILV